MLSYRSNDVASKLTNDVVSCGHKHKKKDTIFIVSFFLEAPPRIELGIRVLQTRALPLGHGAVLSLKRGTLKKRLSVPFWSGLRGSNSLPPPWQGGALPDELHSHFVSLADCSAREWCLRSESNQRHEDFQSSALPTELQRQMATWMGLEPTTSSVTG